MGASCAGRAGCVRSPSRRAPTSAMALFGFAPLPSSPARAGEAQNAGRSSSHRASQGRRQRYRARRAGAPRSWQPLRFLCGAARAGLYFRPPSPTAFARALALPSPRASAPRPVPRLLPLAHLVTRSDCHKVTRSDCYKVTSVPLRGPAMVSALRASAVGTISRGGAAAPRRGRGGSPRIF